MMTMSEPGHLQLHPGLDPEPFECVITAVEEDWLTFDRTFFYPMGGGQPADRGRLCGKGIDLHVVDVRGKGGVTHQVEGVDTEALPDLCGSEVRADIDVVWRNRLSRMHTAQHLVSAVADELWGGRTVGNQIGFERTRIDIGFPDKEQFEARSLQEKVNELIAGGGAVTMGFSPRAELLDDPLVRVNMDLIPAHIDMLRVITIEGVDICPCAGTHVGDISKIGPLEVTRVRSKGAGKLRVEYILVD
mgnify:FL=1